jgi:DNA mismatch repair protein MutS2
MDVHSLECLDFVRIRELVADYALTELGRALAAAIKPVTRPSLVRRWFDQFEELRRASQERGLPPFGGVTDVRETVRRCAPPLQVSAEDLARIGDALAATHAIARYLADLPEDFPELRHLAERIGDFGTIAERIRSVIDERAQVRDEASPKLAAIRGGIQGATQQIRAVVDRLLHEADTRKLLQFPNYTFHNDRLVLPVRAEYRGRLPGIVHRSSDSGATIYVEPSQAVELNNEISNLRGEEAEEIARLLWDLAHEVYINSEAILKTLDALAVLDLLVAKLRFADEFEMRCPQLNEEPRLNVRQARHPLLLELARRKRAADEPVGDVVPISYRLGDDFNLLIITGPNTGGKTVTLKTVGLLTLMAQAGRRRQPFRRVQARADRHR